MKNLIVKPVSMSLLPSGTIAKGDGEFDILLPDGESYPAREKLAEFNVDDRTGKVTKVFKKLGYNKKARAEK